MSITTYKELLICLRSIIDAASQSGSESVSSRVECAALDEDLVYFEKSFAECKAFAKSLSKGDLSAPPPPESNELAEPLRALHSSLKRLRWQAQKVAKGDYTQRVDFMGEFSVAFNTMTAQLAQRQEKLEEDMVQSKNRAKELEYSRTLISTLMLNIPLQIFVVALDTHEILILNDMAKIETQRKPDYIPHILEMIPEYDNRRPNDNVEVRYSIGNEPRYLLINTYPLEWEKTEAVVLVISDVTAEKKRMENLEIQAFYDALTGLYNRFFGMLTLNDWIINKKLFSLAFIDLDNLKYINDKYGHEEGDQYIIKVSGYLKSLLTGCIVCRVGGDEFMMLMPNIGVDDADKLMNELQDALSNAEYPHGRDYSYSLSYGIVAVKADNALPPADILRVADERMYQNKRAKKMKRKESLSG